MRPPCLNCKTRHLKCHSKCDRYKNYAGYFKRQAKKEDREYFDYYTQAIERMKESVR